MSGHKETTEVVFQDLFDIAKKYIQEYSKSCHTEGRIAPNQFLHQAFQENLECYKKDLQVYLFNNEMDKERFDPFIRIFQNIDTISKELKSIDKNKDPLIKQNNVEKISTTLDSVVQNITHSPYKTQAEKISALINNLNDTLVKTSYVDQNLIKQLRKEAETLDNSPSPLKTVINNVCKTMESIAENPEHPPIHRLKILTNMVTTMTSNKTISSRDS